MYKLSIQYSLRLASEMSWFIMRDDTANFEGWTMRTLGLLWFIER